MTEKTKISQSLPHKIGHIFSSIMIPLSNIIDYTITEDFTYNKETNCYTISKEDYNKMCESLYRIQKDYEVNLKAIKEIQNR